MPICKHCLLEFPESETVRDGKRVFCCHACLGIYRLIHDEGLDGFYEKREPGSWRPGPMDTHEVDDAAFADFLRERDGLMELDLTIDGIRCASCVWLNERYLLRAEGVVRATVNYATHRARVVFDPARINLPRVLGRIAAIGYTPKPYRPGHAEEEMRAASRSLLLRFGTAALLSMQLMLYSAALYAGYFEGQDPALRRAFEVIALALCTPVVFYSGWPFIEASLRGLRNMVFNMDVLVTVGAGAAYVYSIHNMVFGGEVYFDTSAMIITFVLLGRYIETGAKGRASEAVARLLRLSPTEATVVTEGGQREKAAVSSIKPGQRIEVAPGGRVPLDAVVREGQSECDESMLTGESAPVLKTPGAEVFAGTLNGLGSMVMEVTRIGADTVLSRIVHAVEDAQSRRAPVQALADRIVGVFVPAILVLAAATFGARYLMGHSMPDALTNAVSVLVIACPCALGLATPLAIVVATTSGAGRGILIRGGDVIERASRLRSAVLDKTGTVTMGRPELAYYTGLGGMSDRDALINMASIEQKSEHLIGRAIVSAAPREGLMEPGGFRAHPGQGISGTLNGRQALAGSRRFLGTNGIEVEESPDARTVESTGQSLVYLALDTRVSGVFGVRDRTRPEAAGAIAELKGLGLGVSMLTGDNLATAEAVAREAGIDEVMAGVSPMEKAARLRELKGSGRGVLMAGDGINDAPGLVEADVGVAVGRATDVALESADIVLMREDLLLLPEAVRLARRAHAVIRQNIFWAFFYNMVAVPLAVAGVLHPIVAAGAMALSSLSVVGNSLRARIK